MRAVEDGRWVVDAAVSGISAFVDPSGRVVSQVGLFQPAILRHTVRSSNVITAYVRYGDWFPWLSLVVVAGMVLVPRRRSGVRPAPEPLPPDRCRTLVILPTYEERDTIEWVLARLLALPAHARHPGRRRLLARRHRRSGARGGGPGTPGQAARTPGEGRARERLPRRFPHGSLGRLRPVRRDGFGPVPRARGAAADARGDGIGSGPRRGEPIRAGRVRHRLEPLARGALEGREHLRPPDARPAHPRRDQRVPGLPAPRARNARALVRCIPTATGSRSSW